MISFQSKKVLLNYNIDQDEMDKQLLRITVIENLVTELRDKLSELDCKKHPSLSTVVSIDENHNIVFERTCCDNFKKLATEEIKKAISFR